MILIDLDHFKSVNDTQGHAAGDRVLREVAAIMQASVRDSDEVFRIGGDEFAVLARARDAEEAVDIGNRVVATVRERTVVTASVGVCVAPIAGRLDEARAARRSGALRGQRRRARPRADCIRARSSP